MQWVQLLNDSRVRMSKNVYLSLALFVSCLPALRGQVMNDRIAASDPALLNSIPYVDISDAKQFHSRLHVPDSEQERANRYDYSGISLFNEHDPKRSDEFRTVKTVDSRGAAPLPFGEADLVAVGVVTSQAVFVNRSGADVYSVFHFVPSAIVKGFSDGKIVFDCYGGVILYPSGKKVLNSITGNSLPLPGHEFLLFFKKVKSTVYYEEIAGFSLEGPHVLALDKEGRSLEKLSPSDLVAKAKAEAAAH